MQAKHALPLSLANSCAENFNSHIFSSMQKEIALYTASKINSEFCWFDIDGDIDPLFKVIYIHDAFCYIL